MGMNFPSAPLFGELYPNPAVPEKPQYKWDGTTWTSVGDTAGGSGVFVSDTEPTPVPDGSLWWKSNQGTLNIKYNDGDTTQWTEAVAIPVPDMTWAAPFDAIAYSGMQVNGAMEVSQELGTTGRTTNGYICDGWYLGYGATATVFAAQAGGGFGPGFSSYIMSYPQVAQTSFGAADYTYIATKVEGYRMARLAWGSASAQPITIGFWSSHGRTGIYSVMVQNSAGDRTYVTTYTQAVALTPQYNVVTIPGDVTGAWGTLNGIGMLIAFSFGCGATYTAPSANTWLGANYVAAPGQVNAVASTSTDVFRITGVVVLPGIMAPTAAQSSRIMRPYDQELLTCQRYFEKLPQNIYGPVTSGSNSFATWSYKVSKRAAPTVTLYTGSQGALVYQGTDACSVYLNTAAQSPALFALSTADARL